MLHELTTQLQTIQLSERSAEQVLLVGMARRAQAHAHESPEAAPRAQQQTGEWEDLNAPSSVGTASAASSGLTTPAYQLRGPCAQKMRPGPRLLHDASA